MLGTNTNILFPKTSNRAFGGTYASQTEGGNGVTSSGYGIPFNPTIPNSPSPSQLQANANQQFWTQHYAPTQGALDTEKALLEERLLRAMGGGNRQGPDTAGHELDLKQLDLELEALGIDKEAALRQPDLIARLFGITTKQFEGDNAYLTQLEGFAGQGKENALGRAGFARDTNTYAQRSDATSRGAINTSGNNVALNNILQQYGMDVADTNLDYNSIIAGIKDKGRTLGNNYERDTIGKEEDLAKAQDRIKTLDNLGKQYGVKREQLENAFQRGIQAIGLANQMDVDQLMDMMNSNNIQQQMLAQQIADAALRAAGTGGGF